MQKKLIISYDLFITETIRAKEAYTTHGSLQTVIDGKRNICYLTYIEIMQNFRKIESAGLRLMQIGGNRHNPHIVYRPGSEEQASELKEIASLYNGYLHINASEEEQRRIGELLEYDKRDINNFIKRWRKIQGL